MQQSDFSDLVNTVGLLGVLLLNRSRLEIAYVLRFSNHGSFVKQQDGTFTHKTRMIEEVLRICITKINCLMLHYK